MAKTFRPYEPDQLRLMPPSLADWVPEDHLARFVSEVVDTLDLEAIEATYPEERGSPPYHPRMMVIDERGRNGRPAPLPPQRLCRQAGRRGSRSLDGSRRRPPRWTR